MNEIASATNRKKSEALMKKGQRRGLCPDLQCHISIRIRFLSRRREAEG